MHIKISYMTSVGESGSDIANEISKYASKCAIAIRGKHGHLIPRIQGNGRVTDLNTNRCRYSNPYVFGDWIGYVNQMAKKWISVFAPDSDQKRVRLTALKGCLSNILSSTS